MKLLEHFHRADLNHTHWSFMLQNGGLPRLIFKNTLGFCSVLPRVHFSVRRTPFIPETGNRKKWNEIAPFFFVISSKRKQHWFIIAYMILTLQNSKRMLQHGFFKLLNVSVIFNTFSETMFHL